MRGSHHESSKKQQGGKWSGALWFLLPITLFTVLKTGFLPQVARLSRETGFTGVADEVSHKVSSSLGLNGVRWEQQSPDTKRLEEAAVPKAPSAASGADISVNVDATREYNKQPNLILATNGAKNSSLINSDVGAPVLSRLTCNFSHYYSNTCAMEGDLRIHGKSGTVYVVASSTYRSENSTVKIRPYVRKWERGTMSKIRELSIRSTPPPAGAADDGIVPPRCTVRHDVPAVVFSTDTYRTNYFHAMSDVMVPLYTSAREYDGNVQLLVTGYDSEWLAKYGKILAALSMYPVVGLDTDAAVRCFSVVRVGLEGHRILGVDPALSRNGYTMMSFRDFLRSTFSLPRAWATPVSRRSSQRKPRLVMVLRRHSRALTNEADAVAAMTDLGFEVVAATPEEVRDMDRFAAVVNSCDVMVGVHGAGLTNMVFLPHNATVVQIIPWGAMKWACWYDFGQPVPGMGLKYVEYEVMAEETTLKKRYPMDHPVFTDPLSVHRKGFNDVWATFLDGQNVTLDIARFKGAMQQVYQSITTE